MMLLRTFLYLLSTTPAWTADSFTQEIRPLLQDFCFDCHGDEQDPQGGLNLERFQSWDEALQERSAWAKVMEKVESQQMPPPKRKNQPSDSQRQQILTWITQLAAADDPVLRARDAGKPLLRRLTRLEYNNSVRDVLGLRRDIFMFPERLPLENSDYHLQPAGGTHVTVPVREYGTKYAVLLPEAGLPGGNRAEHGFANRGDAMNLSPVLLENYLSIARAIVHAPKLPQQSTAFRWLINDPARPFQSPEPPDWTDGRAYYTAESAFAPNLDLPQQATKGGAVTVAYQFRFNVKSAWDEAMGGVWSATARMGTNEKLPATIPWSVLYGPDSVKQLVLTSPQEIWVAGFSTAEEVSGQSLFTNAKPMEKNLEFTLQVERGLGGEAVTDLALCVISREKEKGVVSITVEFSDGTTHALEHHIAPGSGVANTFFAFRAPTGSFISRLRVDGSRFSGNHVLLDDLAFITAADLAPVVPVPPKSLSAKAKRAEAESRLNGFLFQAFRHPVSPATLARYVKIYDEGVQQGDFATGIKAAITAALASPEFLYLTSPQAEATLGVRALDEWELATRLSYFLWSAPPDARLIEAAKTGNLHQSAATLVPSMLADQKARELCESFAVQWLRLDQLYTARPDPDKFKEFYFGDQGKLTMHSAFLVEALLLFDTVLRENRSVLDFIDPNYTWLNLRLAKHYGLQENVKTQAAALGLEGTSRNELKLARANSVWMRTSLTDRRRGGFMAMAGPLTVTSLPQRTSPVKRGAWLLETIFNRPPQEPKIAFVLKDDDAHEVATASVRQRFESHRNKAECFSCHVRLDPPGFALEAYSPTGGWRTQDAGQAVDASAEWGGVPFTGPAEFKKQLLQHPEEFVRGFTEHLLAYALGRKLELFDQPAVAEIVAAARADGWKIHAIIIGIVKSWPFTHCRNQ